MKRLLNLCIAIIATTIGATAQTNNVVGAAQIQPLCSREQGRSAQTEG